MPTGNVPPYKSYVPIFIMRRIATVIRLRWQYMSAHRLLRLGDRYSALSSFALERTYALGYLYLN